MRPMAALNLDRPGGDLAAKTAEPDAVRTRVVARAATRTALRRPDRTRNVAPPYRIDAVSTFDRRLGRAGAVGRAWGPAGWALRRRRSTSGRATVWRQPPRRSPTIGPLNGQGKGSAETGGTLAARNAATRSSTSS